MDATWAIGGGVAGLIAGNLMRSSVFRLTVESGEPDRRTCTGCGRAVGFGPLSPSGRCRRSCRARLGPPFAALEVFTAVLLAVLAGLVGPRPELLGFGWLAVSGVAMAAIDLSALRLPDRLTYPAFAVVLGSFVLGAATGTDPHRVWRALLGALVLCGCYLVLALVSPGQLGLGDVKLAGLLGLALGWAGWRELMFGGCLAFLLSAGASLILLALRRITLRGALPFGPFMLAGAALALLA